MSKQDFLKQCTAKRMADGADRIDAMSACVLDWDKQTAAQLSDTERTLALTAPIDLAAVGPDDKESVQRRFLILGYTGQPITSMWGEKLYIDVAGIACNKKIPILREHERDRPVGFGRGETRDNQFVVDGVFSAYAKDAKDVIDLADEGYPWEASVGIWARAVRHLEDDQTTMVNGQEITGPATIWTQSKVREVSFVTLGADEHTAAIALDARAPEPNSNLSMHKGEQKMEVTLEMLTADAPNLLAQIKQAAAADERARILEILDADGDREITLKAIQEGTPAGDVFKLFFHAEKAKKVAGLQNLAEQAPPVMGEEPPPDPAPQLSADQQLAEAAKRMADTHNIDIAAATRLALEQDMDLARRYAANLIH